MNAEANVTRLISSMVNISASTCIEALANAFLCRRQALQVELAVGLVIFSAEGEASKHAKNELRAMYASAGYLCATSKDADYKNINKRINITAALFAVTGKRQVRNWIGSKAEAEIINAVMSELEPLQFATLDDVLEYCGRPNNKTARQRANAAKAAEDARRSNKTPGGPFNRRADDVKGGFRIDTKVLHFVIPPTAKPAELLEAAAKLIELAKASGKTTKKAAATL